MGMQHMKAIAAHTKVLNSVSRCIRGGKACHCYKPHTDCEFGLWLYSKLIPASLSASAHVQEVVQEIEVTHLKFHNVIKKIEQSTKDGNAEETKKLETDLMGLSNKLIQHILSIDSELSTMEL